MSDDASFKQDVYIGTKYVPNAGSPGNKVWVLGESPGEDEEQALVPFVGQSGQLLRECLREAGFDLDQIYFANLCNYRPYANKFELLENSAQLAKCKADLISDLRRHKPVLVIALGNRPMEFLTGATGITKRRGNVEYSSIPGAGEVKVLSTYHPSYVLRVAGDYPTFLLDIKRAYKESTARSIVRKAREYYYNLDGTQLYNLYIDYKNQRKLSCDIETVKRNKKGEGGQLLCIGFAKSPIHGLCFNAEEPHQLKLAIDLLEDANIEKVFHFGNGFDVPYFFAELGINVQNYKHDTYLAQVVLNPEMSRGLDFLVSTYTDEPAYKSEGRGEIPKDTKAWGRKTNKTKLYLYNCKDACYTYEIHEQQLTELESNGLTGLYEQLMDQTELAFHISHAGVPVDGERVDLMRKSLLFAWAKLQFLTNGLILVGSGGAMDSINVRSTPQKIKLLYDIFGLPKRYKTVKGVSRLATDEDALVSLITYCEGYIDKLKTDKAKQDWRLKKQVLHNILAITEFRQLLSNYVLARRSSDGRFRSIYNVGGPETGRWAAMRYIDQTGFNAQTFPRGIVRIFEDDGISPIVIGNVVQQLAEEASSEDDEEELAA